MVGSGAGFGCLVVSFRHSGKERNGEIHNRRYYRYFDPHTYRTQGTHQREESYARCAENPGRTYSIFIVQYIRTLCPVAVDTPNEPCPVLELGDVTQSQPASQPVCHRIGGRSGSCTANPGCIFGPSANFGQSPYKTVVPLCRRNSETTPKLTVLRSQSVV